MIGYRALGRVPVPPPINGASQRGGAMALGRAAPRSITPLNNVNAAGFAAPAGSGMMQTNRPRPVPGPDMGDQGAFEQVSPDDRSVLAQRQGRIAAAQPMLAPGPQMPAFDPNDPANAALAGYTSGAGMMGSR